MAEIPYFFDTPIPKYFRETGWFESEHMFKFVNWAFSKCQTISHKEILYGREITLASFEFIAGRLSSHKECFLSENIFRNQITKLVDSGLLTKTSNSLKNKYSCYVWNVSVFCRLPHNISTGQEPTDDQQMTNRSTNRITNKKPSHIISKDVNEKYDNQQNNQQITNRQPTDNHKQRTKNKDVVLSCLKETDKEKSVDSVRENLSLSRNEKEEQRESLMAYFNLHSLDISEKTVYRWLSKHPVDIIIDSIQLLLQQKKAVPKPGGWLETALTEKYVIKNRNAEVNRQFALKFKNENSIQSLKLLKKYCRDIITGNDYQYEIDPQTFKCELERKYSSV